MKLSTITKILHMIIAFSMIALLAVGLYMAETETFSLYPIHKSIGAIVFVIALIRVIVRIKEGWPEPIGQAAKFQLIIAKLVHWGLLLMTVLYPLSGLMMSGAGGHGIKVFGLDILASNYDAITGEAIPLNENIAYIGHEFHELMPFVLLGLIVLHVAGAIKHHFVDKDDTVKRMFSFK